MPAEINVFLRTATGGKAHIKVASDTFDAAGKEYLEAVKFVKDSGWTEDSNAGAAQRFFGGDPQPQPTAVPARTPTPPPASRNTSALVCVEDGTTITPAIIMNKRYTAEELAGSRAKKSVELGLIPPGPRCDDCWRSGGYAQKYKALRGFPS